MRLRAGEEVHAAPERDRSARGLASRQTEAMPPYRPGALRTHQAASVRGGTGGARGAAELETGRAAATARKRAPLRREPCGLLPRARAWTPLAARAASRSQPLRWNAAGNARLINLLTCRLPLSKLLSSRRSLQRREATQ